MRQDYDYVHIEENVRASKMAYEQAGISPATIGHIEAHGTGTRVGDEVEFQALRTVFSDTKAHTRQCALGSVKSMIGHAKAAAGSAGLGAAGASAASTRAPSREALKPSRSSA